MTHADPKPPALDRRVAWQLLAVGAFCLVLGSYGLAMEAGVIEQPPTRMHGPLSKRNDDVVSGAPAVAIMLVLLLIGRVASSVATKALFPKSAAVRWFWRIERVLMLVAVLGLMTAACALLVWLQRQGPPRAEDLGDFAWL